MNAIAKTEDERLADWVQTNRARGVTFSEMADRWGVSDRTFRRWRNEGLPEKRGASSFSEKALQRKERYEYDERPKRKGEERAQTPEIEDLERPSIQEIHGRPEGFDATGMQNILDDPTVIERAASGESWSMDVFAYETQGGPVVEIGLPETDFQKSNLIDTWSFDIDEPMTRRELETALWNLFRIIYSQVQ